MGTGDHIPIDKAASVADCGAYTLTKNVTTELLKPAKSGEQLINNDSDSMTVVGDLDSILTSMIEDSKKVDTDISLDLPQLEDELEPEIPKAPRKTRKSKKQKLAEEAAAKQRKFFTKYRLKTFLRAGECKPCTSSNWFLCLPFLLTSVNYFN